VKCEYCDSFLPVFPDNGCCPNCGAVLPAPEPEKPEFPEPPLGIYNGVYGSMEVGQSSVRLQKKITLDQYTDYEISYSELTGAVYQPARGENRGYLCLRCTLNQHTPFPRDWSDAILEPTTIVFKEGANGAFSKVNDYLQSCLETDFHTLQTPKVYFPIPPVGVYQGRSGKLEITQDAVCFVKKFLLIQQTVYRIPFENLVAVAITPASWWNSGELKVRCWQNRRMGFQSCFHDYETSILFHKSDERYFYGIYGFLQECARIANAAREEK
jgi:hypothetical protein